MKAGSEIGMTMRRKILKLLAPSTRAASSNSSGMVMKNCLNKSVAVAYIGKLKTAAQMIAITLLLWYGPLPFIEGKYTILLGTIALYLAGILTIISMVYYLKVAADQFRE